MSTVSTSLIAGRSTTGTIRLLSLAVAVLVVVDALSVGAPFLALLAVPFALGAVLLRQARGVGAVLLAVWSGLDVVIAVNYAVANRLDAPWGDVLGVYVCGPVSLAIVILVARSFRSVS